MNMHHLSQSEWREVWSEASPLLSASLHTRGCVEAVRAPLTRALLALQFFNMLVFLFQVSLNSIICHVRIAFRTFRSQIGCVSHWRAQERAFKNL